MKKSLLLKLYTDELKDLYSAEHQLINALPKMAAAATDPDLRKGFEEHLMQTREHAKRIEDIFKTMEGSPKGKHCNGMEGLIEEGSELIQEKPEKEELNAGLIAAAQRVEHYEIAGYGCVRTYAKLLGDSSAVSLLEKTLQEEKDTDTKLTKLSEKINQVARDTDEKEKKASA